MHRPNAPVSLAELSAAGIQLRPEEAAAIVRELVLLVVSGQVAGVPSPHVIKLSGAGLVSVEGPVAAGGRPVMRAAQLLDSLLPSADAASDLRVPGGLKLVVARALGTLDLPPFPSLESFAEALARFAAADAAAVITNLVTSWSDSVEVLAPQASEVEPVAAAQVQPFVSSRTQDVRAHLSHDPLTISDIRRARRATGLPLASIAERSHIPIGMLRQLEWGYFANWPTGQYGRTQLVRYARAAGLDEELVIATVLPQIEEAERTMAPAARTQAALAKPAQLERKVIEGEVADAPLGVIEADPAGAWLLRTNTARPDAGRRRWAFSLGALAIPALLAISLLPLWWDRVEPILTPPASGTTEARRPEVVPAPAAKAPESQPAPVSAKGSTEPDAVPASASAAAPPRGTPAAAYQLTSDRGFSPSFASVGTAVFYHGSKSGGSPLLRADTDTDGSVLRITRIVDDTANNFHVRPSPDGTRIAFDSDRDGEPRGVYVADADGQHVRRVSGEGFAAVPSWSPDGGTLAFVRENEQNPKAWNLWTLELATGETKRITRDTYGTPWGGSWFPDGRRIAFSHETRLVIHDLDDGSERAFDTPIKGRLVRTPAVSPDGRRIVFQVRRAGTWLLDLRNGTMRRILEDPTAEEYAWSPDGRRVAYHSSRSGGWGMWVMASR